MVDMADRKAQEVLGVEEDTDMLLDRAVVEAVDHKDRLEEDRSAVAAVVVDETVVVAAADLNHKVAHCSWTAR